MKMWTMDFDPVRKLKEMQVIDQSVDSSLESAADIFTKKLDEAVQIRRAVSDVAVIVANARKERDDAFNMIGRLQIALYRMAGTADPEAVMAGRCDHRLKVPPYGEDHKAKE